MKTLDQLNREFCLRHSIITPEQLRERDALTEMNQKHQEALDRRWSEPEVMPETGPGTLYHCPRFRGDRMSEE